MANAPREDRCLDLLTDTTDNRMKRSMPTYSPFSSKGTCSLFLRRKPIIILTQIKGLINKYIPVAANAAYAIQEPRTKQPSKGIFAYTPCGKVASCKSSIYITSGIFY